MTVDGVCRLQDPALRRPSFHRQESTAENLPAARSQGQASWFGVADVPAPTLYQESPSVTHFQDLLVILRGVQAPVPHDVFDQLLVVLWAAGAQGKARA